VKELLLQTVLSKLNKLSKGLKKYKKAISETSRFQENKK